MILGLITYLREETAERSERECGEEREGDGRS